MKLSIVVIEYNSLADIVLFAKQAGDCFRGIDYELIVSSNSMYGTRQRNAIKELYPDIVWVFNERNGGFAYGMNRGLEKARGDYLLITNPDVIFTTGIEAAVDSLQKNHT